MITSPFNGDYLRSSAIAACAAAVIGASVLMAFGASAQTATEDPPMFLMMGSEDSADDDADAVPSTGKPVDVFQGCGGADAPAEPGESPRDRMNAAKSGANVIKQRQFASLSYDEVQGEIPDALKGECWYRIDGVWREEANIVLDRTKDPKAGWGADSPGLLALANGNYTTPSYLVVLPSDNYNKGFQVVDSLKSFEPVLYLAPSHNISLDEVLKPGGPKKIYHAIGPTPFGRELSIDVTRTGRVRLSVGGKDFLRPKPGVANAARGRQEDIDDVFMLAYNLENLAASHKGYDITSQDGFFLLENPKWSVFERSRDYVIDEKRTVPLGLTLIQESPQGMVYMKNLVSSGTALQESIATNYGANVGVDNEFVTATVGGDYANAQMTAMQENKTVSQATGYSRAKLYALVLDAPYAKLSDNLLDAVEDARRYDKKGEYYRRVIEKFGTHYPYAVTYGAAAKITQSFSEEQFVEKTQADSSFQETGAAKYLGSGGELRHGAQEITGDEQSGTIGNEGATFLAVGGNGSWNENGFAAGNTPYPILLDLRPLYELLNPINFPREPEIYKTARAKLESAINAYLAERASRPVSNASLLPEIWEARITHMWCDPNKSSVRVDGASYVWLTAHFYGREPLKTRLVDAYLMHCPENYSAKMVRAEKASKKLTFHGTRPYIDGMSLYAQIGRSYREPISMQEVVWETKEMKLPQRAVGETYSVDQRVTGGDRFPILVTRLEFKRIR